jgi:hypothetical protein
MPQVAPAWEWEETTRRPGAARSRHDGMSLSAEALFERVFLPLYPADLRGDLARVRREDANPAKNPALLVHLEDAAERFAALAPSFLREDLALDFSDASVHRLGAALTRETRNRLLAQGEIGTAENALFNLVIHGASYVLVCIAKNHAKTEIRLRRPLWESLVFLVSKAGEAELSPFSWWIRSLGDEAFLDAAEATPLATLGDRYRQYVENAVFDGANLPVWLPTDRRLPKLAKVRYDLMYKHLKAHLPELKDLGADFPSPERFEGYGFKFLHLNVVGDGRMALFHGLGEGGYHLFWVGKNGFEKAAFYPCEAFPEPKLEEDGEQIRLLVAHDGKTLRHEFFFWGP